MKLHLGYNHKYKLWVWENAICDTSGNLVYINNEELREHEKIDYVLNSGSPSENHIDLLYKCYGLEAIPVLLFAVASVFKAEIEESLKFFPVLQISGEHPTGKTSLGYYLSAFNETRVQRTFSKIKELSSYRVIKQINKIVPSYATIFFEDEYTDDESEKEYALKSNLVKSCWDAGVVIKVASVKKGMSSLALNNPLVIFRNEHLDYGASVRCIKLQLENIDFNSDSVKNYEALISVCRKGLNQETYKLFSNHNEFINELELFNDHVSHWEKETEILNGTVTKREIHNISLLTVAYCFLKSITELPFTNGDFAKSMQKLFENSMSYESTFIRPNN